jgi:hypothetical protein
MAIPCPTRLLKKCASGKVNWMKWWRGCMSNPAQSTSRNPLEGSWSLTGEEFARQVERKTSEVSETSEVWKAAREETSAVTEEIGKVESAIDERVKGLYGV